MTSNPTMRADAGPRQRGRVASAAKAESSRSVQQRVTFLSRSTLTTRLIARAFLPLVLTSAIERKKYYYLRTVRIEVLAAWAPRC